MAFNTGSSHLRIVYCGSQTLYFILTSEFVDDLEDTIDDEDLGLENAGTKKPKTFLNEKNEKKWIIFLIVHIFHFVRKFFFLIFRKTTPPDSLCIKFKITMIKLLWKNLVAFYKNRVSHLVYSEITKCTFNRIKMVNFIQLVTSR